jgi:rRNA maturation endonuclease Nob1
VKPTEFEKPKSQNLCEKCGSPTNIKEKPERL